MTDERLEKLRVIWPGLQWECYKDCHGAEFMGTMESLPITIFIGLKPGDKCQGTVSVGDVVAGFSHRIFDTGTISLAFDDVVEVLATKLCLMSFLVPSPLESSSA
jgi:hypothetical protein